MSRDKDFKRLVRRRMGKTGESYTTARARLLGTRRHDAPPSGRRSREPMYPFEQFTDRAKKVLAVAQTQAETAGSRQITTEHVLLALFGDEEGVAARVLGELHVTPDAVRQAVHDHVAEPEEDVPAGAPPGPLPTGRVRRVVELAFHAAQMMGHVYVGTEHLLLGILEEGQGTGARALAQLGVRGGAVRDALDRMLGGSPGHGPVASAAPRQLPNSPEIGALLAEGRFIAEGEEAPSLRLDHVLRALASRPETARLLNGVDLAALAGRLNPPEELTGVQRRLARMRREKTEAINRQDYERAAELRDEEAAARAEWRDAYAAWVGHTS